ncbi:MAG: LamG domain-containing protein [Thermoguttaceae bacterium]|jgi:hypothetical protein|nr:LamG domain-containing protein [Thermoguttaceae bacterium]
MRSPSQFLAASLLVLMFPGLGPRVACAALVGVWHLNEASGPILDVSGNDFHGTFTGGAAGYGHPSPFVTALRFNGSSHVDVGNPFDLNDRSFSIEMWVNQDPGPTGNQLVASKRDTASTSLENLHLRLYNTGQIRMDWYGNSANSPVGTFIPGNWHHLAFTYDYDPVAGNGVRKIYYDGQIVANQSNITPYKGSGGPFYIGSWGTSEYFRGLINEVRVHDVAMDAATVANHAGGLYETHQPQALVLVHHNDDAANPIQDSSFWSNHGTYSGTALQAPGRFLYGLGYNGADDWTHVADSTEINFANRSFSVEAWIKQEAGASGQQVIFSKRDTPGANNADMHLRVLDGGSLLFGFYGNDLSAPAGSLTQDQWHHVAFVMDLGDTGNSRYIYVDGNQVAHDTPATAYQGDDAALQFGRWYSGASGQHFQGTMDEARIYNYALDAATVARHATGRYAQFQPEVPLLVMHMEDRSGPIRDATGMYSGNYTGNQYRQPGAYGCSALGFDGSSRVEVATDRVLDFDERSFTIEMWVNQSNPTGEQVIMSKTDRNDGQSTQRDMHLRIYDNGRIRFDWWANALDTATGVFEPGDWRHLAFTYEFNNPEANTGIRRIYYDGQMVAEQTAATPYLGSGGTLYIGSWAGSQYFQGLIDEFRVYNYALDPAAVAMHYQRQYELFAIPEPGTLLLLALAGMWAVACRRRGG